MYEAFFALRTRPFSAIADRDSYVTTPAVEDALRNTLDCVLAGNGPAIVTAATGVGKTAFCGELLRRAGERLQCVFLGSTGFGHSLELWQAVLFELGREFTGLTEHEAQLRVIEAARSRSPEGEGLLLVVDEAQRLEPRLLDDLWRLTTQLADGRPVIRLVLCGQLELEDRLASPELDALNQHVGSHVILEPLTGEESRRFVVGQLERAGAAAADVFSEDALTLICRASDGNCRALNQLCDHSLLLAFVEEEQPVTAGTVQAALDDLKGLPQHWNDVTLAPDDVDPAFDADPSVPVACPAVPALNKANVEREPTAASAGEPDLRADDGAAAEEWDSAGVAVIEVGGDESDPTFGAAVSKCAAEQPTAATAPVVESGADETREFWVEDPYARLDRLAEHGATINSGPHIATAGSANVPVSSERQILAQVIELRDEIRSGRQPTVDVDLPTADAPPLDDAAIPDDDELAWDVIEPESDEPAAVEFSTSAWGVAASATVAEPSTLNVEEPAAGPCGDPVVTAVSGDRPAPSEGRRYAQLFTRLQRRRRDVAGALGTAILLADG